MEVAQVCMINISFIDYQANSILRTFNTTELLLLLDYLLLLSRILHSTEFLQLFIMVCFVVSIEGGLPNGLPRAKVCNYCEISNYIIIFLLELYCFDLFRKILLQNIYIYLQIERLIW